MEYSILSKHRSKVMAVAMLWIAFFHSSCWFNQKAVSFLKINGFGGVDIFLFLFSFGMVYSLNKKKALSQFFYDRCRRILPYVIPVFVLVCFIHRYDVSKSLLFLHFLDFWSGNNTTLWYVAALPVFVLMAPAYMSVLRKNRRLSVLVAVWVSVLAFVMFKEKTQMIFASRLPVYFLGFHVGELSYQHRTLKKPDLALMMLMMAAGLYFLYYNYHHYGSMMWSHGLYWYPFVLMTPGLCFLCALVFELLDAKMKKLGQLMNALGAFTLEFYLFHEIVIRSVDSVLYMNWDPQGIARNVFSFLLALLIAVGYHALIQKTVLGLKVFHR